MTAMAARMNVSTSSTGKPPHRSELKILSYRTGRVRAPPTAPRRPEPRRATSHEPAIKLLKLLRRQFALGGAAVAAFDTELQFVGAF
jgi:hypothetical protein